MLGELQINPITPPFLDPLAFDPQNKPPELEFQIGVEKKITTRQKEWLFCRDNGLCSFPIVNKDGTFGGYLFEESPPSRSLDFHHIQEKAVLRRDPVGQIALANGWHNSPTNLILLDKRVHTWLHKTGTRWVIEEYKNANHKDKISYKSGSDEDWVSWALSFGLPITKPRYDIYLTAIATLRTLYMLEKINDNWFPFEPVYKKHAESQFYSLMNLIPNFIDSYIEHLNID